jgi:archaellum biogenesis protein FlaJ (TadC family)
MKRKGRIQVTLWFCYLLTIWGVVASIADYVSRTQFSFPFNLGIVLGNGAIALIGLVGIALCRHIQKIEDRLSKLENS